VTFANLTQYSQNADLFAWAYGQAYSGNRRIYDPSFGIAKDPDLPTKMRRDPVIDSALRHRQQMGASREWSVDAGGPTEADRILGTIGQDAFEQIRRFDSTRYRIAEACFRGASYEAVEGDFVTMRLGEDSRPRRWWVPQMTKHVDKRMLRQVNVGSGPVIPGSSLSRSTTETHAGRGVNIKWEMYGTSDRTWHELTDTQSRAMLRLTYDLTMSTLGYGGGLIEPLYWYFYAKGIALSEGLNGVETWARGWITAQVDGIRAGDTDKKNADKVAAAIDVLENMRSRHVLVYGEDTNLNVLDKGGQGHQIVTAYVEYLDREMRNLILGSNLAVGGGGDKTGSFARAETESETTETLIQFDQAQSEEMFTHDLMGLFLHVNRAAIAEAGLADAASPVFSTVREKVSDPEVNGRVISQALSSGVTLKLEEVYEKLGMTKPEEGEETIGGPEFVNAGIGAGDLFPGVGAGA